MHVLLIGSYKLLVKALKQGLEEEGITADVAHTSQESDYKVRTAAYDAIILDLKHPQEASLSLLHRWRRAGLQTPVFVLTGPGTHDDRTRALDAGANDWLNKPFELEELFARLRSLAALPLKGTGSNGWPKLSLGSQLSALGCLRGSIFDPLLLR
jgi:DNA-binding response OmpR family regulator